MRYHLKAHASLSTESLGHCDAERNGHRLVLGESSHKGTNQPPAIPIRLSKRSTAPLLGAKTQALRFGFLCWEAAQAIKTWQTSQDRARLQVCYEQMARLCKLRELRSVASDPSYHSDQARAWLYPAAVRKGCMHPATPIDQRNAMQGGAMVAEHRHIQATPQTHGHCRMAIPTCSQRLESHVHTGVVRAKDPKTQQDRSAQRGNQKAAEPTQTTPRGLIHVLTSRWESLSNFIFPPQEAKSRRFGCHVNIKASQVLHSKRLLLLGKRVQQEHPLKYTSELSHPFWLSFMLEP